MRFYYDVFRFNLLTAVAYPIEILSFTLKKLITLSFLLFFWFVVSKTNPDIFNFRYMISYFLISLSIGEIAMVSSYAFGRNIQKQIKSGEFSNSLIKPVNIIRFLYVSFLGFNGVSVIYSLVALVCGVIILPPENSFGVLLFFPAVIATIFASIGINILIGVVGFYSPEASSIKNVAKHITTILSGGLIPLDYFPATIRAIASFTPFPVLTYYPTIVLQKGSLNADTLTKIGLSVIWAAILMVVSNLLWKKALKNFDGVGI
jgi:ABC-2 type transport system permease protein